MQSKTRRKNSKKRWIGRVLLKSVAPEEPMLIASVHPMVVGRSDALALVQVWEPLEIKWRKKWSTGWTDGFKIGIGAFNVPCSRDDVKRAGAKSSAPVELVVRRSKASEQWRQQGQWLQDDQESPVKPTSYVAKMVSYVIFQYNVLAIDDTHNTWTNIWLLRWPFSGF